MAIDATSLGTKLSFVRSQLNAYSGPKKQLSDSVLVVCPYHADTDPSARIWHSDASKSPGYFRCYGCGKHAKWDEVAPLLGLQPFKAPKPQDEYTRDLNLKPLSEDSEEDDGKGELQIIGDIPPKKVWRNIPTSLLIDLGGKMCNVYYSESDYTTEHFIYLPVVVRKRLRGYIRARMKKVKDKPSYLNSAGKWGHKYGLFPLDYAIALMQKLGLTTMVLVEGPRDALRLLKFGIPAVAILGTQSWSETKTKMLELSGVETVVLVFDADAAGKKATQMIKGAVNMMLNTKVFKIPESPEGEEDWDPGNCPVEVIHDLKRRLKIS